MNSRVLTIFLAVGVVLSLTILAVSVANNVHLPGNNVGYEPAQPIAYSHRLHAGELGIACLHCHTGAEKSRHAGIPSLGTCMNCHRFVSGPWVDVKGEDELATTEKRKPRQIISPEIKKIYDALALDSDLKRDSTRALQPVAWTRIHNLPDFAYFDHRAHVSSGVQCQTCHGPVETMERIRQVSDLTMGWCVNCHRDVNANGVDGKTVAAPTDCSGCHY